MIEDFHNEVTTIFVLEDVTDLHEQKPLLSLSQKNISYNYYYYHYLSKQGFKKEYLTKKTVYPNFYYKEL